MGVIAIAVLADEISGPTAVGAVMIARVLPGFLIGPLAGVVADRWDRKKVMVYSDIARAVVIFSLPFFPSLVYLLFASVLLESLTLMWGPAKDASLPHFVPPSHLPQANSLGLIAVYAPWPLASIVFAFMATLGQILGDNVPVLQGLQDNPEALALWIDSLTFAFSGFMISTLAITSSRARRTHLDMGQVKHDLVEGLSFVARHKQVRPWIIGIAFTFTAAGGVFSLGVGFVENVLGGGPRGFAFLIGFLGTGMIVGLLAVGFIAKFLQKDVLFSSALLLTGVSLIALASMSTLEAAIPIASALGFFGGAAYSMGYALVQETTVDELRGRTFSAAYTVIRIGTLVGLGLFPFIASAIGDHDINLPGGSHLELPGARTTLWLAGGFAIVGGLLSIRAIRERTGPSTGDAAGARGKRGYLVVFEGGEGAGKSTQMAALVKWLEARGDEVVTTREPGGTSIGNRIRDILLNPEAAEMDGRTEALLYAADRAQHVAEVIGPALSAGKIVVSDRFVDSSLAYQGIARDLGLEKVLEVSRWATGGIEPDLVFYLELDPQTGLSRISERPDRMELAGSDFHERVRAAYRELAEKFPERFVVLNASRSPEEVHTEIVKTLEERTSGVMVPPPVDIDPPINPLPR